MSIVKVIKNTYTAEPLYQWDLNQVLQVYGLSLARVPEVHFSNTAMSRAIVRQATMDAAGVITVDIPNSLLQKPYTINVHICGYTGATFETYYKLELPVKERPQPADYTLVDDPEVYSFNALENKIDNAVISATVELQNANQAVKSAEATLKAAANNLDDKVDEAVTEHLDASVDAKITDAVDAAVADMLDDTLTDETKAANAKKTGDVIASMHDILTARIANQVATRARVVVRTYQGTGGSGVNNKNELTFDGELLAICINDPADRSGDNDGLDDIHGGYMWVKGVPHGKVSEKKIAYLTWTTNSVQWYTNYNASGSLSQLNSNGKTYYCVAILKEETT